jgi:hypothetical protein
LGELQSFASNDATYKLVIKHKTQAFPNLQAQDSSVKLQINYKVCDKMTINSGGFLVRNDTFLEPQVLVPTYLKRFLSMHQAAPKMLVAVHGSQH